MKPRRFGSTDLQVSPIGVGCARIGGVFQGGEQGFIELLSASLDAGINFFDTADIYSQGESEALLGRAFRGRRDRVIIAGKAGYTLPAQRRFAGRLKPLLRPLIRKLGITRENLPAAVRGGEPSHDFSARHLRRALEGSLRRLGTDRLDLFQLHSPPATVVERGEWLETVEGLKREGKIRYYGVACESVEAALAALKFPGVSSLQITVNLLERSAVETLLPRAQEQGVAVIARECLANGLLIKDAQAIDLKAYCRSPEEVEFKSRRLAFLRQQAAANHCSLSKLALDFVTQLPGVSVSLLGVRTVRQLSDNLLQLAQPPLSAEQLLRAGTGT